MKQFKLLNSVFGWVTFFIATTVYMMTLEPTASFWDCGEFIATSFKMEVGHPPGDFMIALMQRFFSLFAGGDLQKVAFAVNVMSGLASGFTILLLFWSITHIARKIVFRNENYSLGNSLAIIGAGLVGALAYTFSDSFWFSAVEAEVYATSSLFTALVFWLMLKWEDRADEKNSNRLIILIAYLMGLSIGVHLLNLLAIPALVFLYYFKKFKVTTAGIVKTAIISIALLGAVQYGIVQGLIYGAAYMDLLFVNGFGLPFYSGVIFYILAIITVIIWGLIYSYKKSKILLNTVILVFAVLVMGYSSVTITVIRSMANPPLDENDPENMFSLLYYLNREQYGDRPLLYGPVYNAVATEVDDNGKPTYTPINGKYEITNRKTEYKYDDRFKMLFPRMYSPDPDHVKAYQQWVNIQGIPIEVQGNNGEMQTIYKPTFGENLAFFFKYQVNFMYFRYFMWNFAGRQNDIQGNGEITKGNWITGIKFYDEMRLGPQDKQPESLSKNRGRNFYFMLPFILGIIGLFYQFKRDKKYFSILMLFFFFTGLAIVIYLNQTPYQPRERDYAYVGSFYVFAMWIGLGVLALYDFLKGKLPEIARATAITVVCVAAVPGIMAHENWDDHDRSGRYTARDFAYNYLNSCDKDAIIFTNGDNDTFPLWYCQEVENVRTDVRVCNLSYLSADWYIDQMERKMYESDPLPFSMKKDKILQGKRDIVFVTDKIKGPVDLKEAIDFVASDDPNSKVRTSYSEEADYIPSKRLSLAVDTAELFTSGYLSRDMADKVVPRIDWTLNRNYITKSGLMILDLLANNHWKRPVYFAITVARDNYLELDNYLQICGLTYKVVPIKSDASRGDITNIDTKVAYDNYMNKFRWGGVNNPKVYLDENNLRMLSNFRSGFAKLANALIAEGKRDSAISILNKALEVMPDKCVPYNYFMIPFVDLYYKLNKPEIADPIANKLYEVGQSELNYLFRLDANSRQLLEYEMQINLHILQQISIICSQYNKPDLAKKCEDAFREYYGLYQQQEQYQQQQ